MRWQNYNLLILNLVFDIMKEEGNQQKQMLINRLYKTKNTQNTVKPVMKSDDDTKLLFYVFNFSYLANSQEVLQGKRIRA